MTASSGFDAKAEALKIEGLAKQCIDDYGSQHLPDAHRDEMALVREVRSIWGDKSKMQAVGSELEQISRDSLTDLPNIRIGYESNTGTIKELAFWNSHLDNKVPCHTGLTFSSSAHNRFKVELSRGGA